GSAHQPSSEAGAVIFVKLQQMAADDRQLVRIDTGDPAAWHRESNRDVCPLFSRPDERVWLGRLDAGANVFDPSGDRAELLILTGQVVIDGRTLDRGSWIRLPEGACPTAHAGAQGASVFRKTGGPRVR